MSALERQASLQDRFLNECRRGHVPVTIFLMKGVKLGGIITWFDNFSLLLKRDGQVQLVYKHSISTIVPGGPLELAGLTATKGKGALQDLFLSAAERQSAALKLFLVNGVMLVGHAASHDQFVLLLVHQGHGQLVYKHAISTIQPEEFLDLQGEDSDGGDA